MSVKQAVRLSAVLWLSLAIAPAWAEAVSIPVERAWAEGTRWEHHDRFLGMPDTWVYVPESFSLRVPDRRAAVFHLMGCGQMTFQIAQAAGWPEAAEAHGIVVVVPGIIDPAHPNRDAPNVACFNYGYDGGFGVYRPTRDDPDQAAIIAAGQALTTDRALAELRIDPDQVYIAGMSAGGATAMEVGCMAPDVFAGVATAAAPGIGSAQGTAVMPPRFGFDADSVATQCRGYARTSEAPDALDRLAEQVHAIVSDNNGLPAGAGPGDTSKFYDQTVWDGDKFCPNAYQGVRAEALIDLLGLQREPTRRGVAVEDGTGMGCPGGERSRDDGGDVQCQINRSVDRDWVALADEWTDDQGRTRLVRIEQDTLRHAWPSGSPGAGDVSATPTRDQLRADGYMDADTGEFNRDRMNGAANGIYGAIYLNDRAMDFPMFVAQLWADNNPRLVDAPPADPEPDDPADDPVDDPAPLGERPEVSLGSVQAPRPGCISAQGGATDLDGDLVGVSVSVLGIGPRAAALQDSGDWSFELCDLQAGDYTLFAVAADAEGGAGDPSPLRSATVQGAGGDAQSVDGTLTDHANAGRVIRFTPIYFEYRDRYCVFEGFRWTCESFTLQRCSDDEDWTDEDPGCPADEPGVATLSLQIGLAAVGPPGPADPEGTVTVGDPVALTVQIANEGPADARAAYARVTLPPSLAARPGGACEAYAAQTVCHLGPLAAGDTADVTVMAAAVAPGQAPAQVVAGSPQTPADVTAEAPLVVLPAPEPDPVRDPDPDPPAEDPAPDPVPDPDVPGDDPAGEPAPADRPDPPRGADRPDDGSLGDPALDPAPAQTPHGAGGASKPPCGDSPGAGVISSGHVSEPGGCAMTPPGDPTAPAGHLPLLLLGLALLHRRRRRGIMVG